MELLSTVIRNRNNVKFFGMANNVSLVNPHFSYWNLQVNPHKQFTKAPNGMVVVELFTDQDFINQMLTTEFGKLAATTEYGNYAIYNESLCDNTAFIMKRPKELMKYKVGFIVEGKELHVWYNQKTDQWYVDQTGIGNTNKEIYVVTEQDYTPDKVSIKIAKQKYSVQLLKIQYQYNNVFYNNLETQMLFQTLIKYI